MLQVGSLDFVSLGVDDLETGNLGRLSSVYGENDRGMRCTGVQLHVWRVLYLSLIVSTSSVKALKITDTSRECACQQLLTRVEAVQMRPKFLGREHGVPLELH